MKIKSIAIILMNIGVLLVMASSVLANDEVIELESSIPGRTEKTGKHFEIKDSEYLNITLESTEEIKVTLESIPRMISMNISSSTDSISANLTIGGLEPNKTYYKYQDSYKNGIEIMTNENGSYSWNQDLAQPHHIWFQEEKGTIFLPKDCSGYGIWDITTRTCTLTKDLTESVQIEENWVNLDCNLHKIIGSNWSGYGVYLNKKENVTIKNCSISNFSTGIVLLYSSDVIIQENNISSNAAAIQATGYPNSNLKIQTNILSNNSWISLFLGVKNSQLINNEILNNGFSGLHLSGIENIIQGNNISNNGVIGLRLYDFDNKVIGNSLTSNGEYGILLEYAWENTISQNNINLNQKYGIRSWCSGKNIIFLNNLINNKENYSWAVWPGCGIPSANIFNSPEKLSYFYNNKKYLNYLGNYWSDYLGFDINGDGIGEIPYSWGLDNYPLVKTIENYTILPPNQPPIISNQGQFKSDGIVSINEGDTTTDSTIVFKATLNDPDDDQIKLQIELKEFNQPFNEQDLLESDFVNSGSEAIITRYGLVNGQYHWRARAIDSRGSASGWQEFGMTENVDFEVSLPLSTKAAMLAKELVNTLYLYGGKGWDYNLSKFVAANTIKTGYTFWNQEMGSLDFDAGVDCSGLVMWAYDRSFNPNKPRFENFVKAEGADEQYRYNTTSTTESELQPGDVMFFDFDQNNFIDHVAMYVGESGGYDVVSAVNRATGIVGRLKNNLKQPGAGFVAFKQVIPAPQLAILVSAYSPVDLVVTDPDGFTITPTTTIPSDLEFLHQIPGILYYSEMEKGIDGNPIDQVYSYTSKIGDYKIRVFSALGTPPTATYTLDFTAGNQSITLAQNVPISQIPTNGYGVTMSATGTISSFIPVAIDIKPGSYPNSINLKSKGVVPVAVLTDQFFDAKNVVTSSVIFAGAKPIKGKLEDIDNDGDLDLILHFNTQSLQLTPTSTEAVLIGQLTNGILIKGTDSVRIVQAAIQPTILARIFFYLNQFIRNLISAIGLGVIQ